MKIAAAILLVIVLTLAWLLYAEVSTNRELRSQSIGLAAKLSDKTTRDNLALQEKCALQAEKIFHKLGHLLRSPDKDATDSYSSHYNAKLNKCFLSIATVYKHTKPAGISVGWHLLDAYEQRDYGMYASPVLIQGGASQPTLCVMMPESANEQTCSSEQEYKTFVARYME